MSISKWPTNERPRERLLNQGADALSDAELLAIFFRTGTKGLSAVELSRQLLKQFSGLATLLDNLDHLSSINGLGPAKIAQLKGALELGKRYLHAELCSGEPITHPRATKRYLISKLRGYQREVFACIFMDTQHRVIKYEELFFGTIDQSEVHVREIVKKALYFNSASIILAHNHPSGNPEPSCSDYKLTQTIKTVLAALDIVVADHIVVGHHDAISFHEQGML